MALSTQITALSNYIGQYIKLAVLPRLIPSGGASGAMLAKAGTGNYAVGWVPLGAIISAMTSGASGSMTLSDGTIIKWGTVAAGGTDAVFSFPVAFPNICWGVLTIPQTSGTNGSLLETCTASERTRFGFTPRVRYVTGGSVGPSGSPVFYVAIGN